MAPARRSLGRTLAVLIGEERGATSLVPAQGWELLPRENLKKTVTCHSARKPRAGLRPAGGRPERELALDCARRRWHDRLDATKDQNSLPSKGGDIWIARPDACRGHPRPRLMQVHGTSGHGTVVEPCSPAGAMESR